MGKNALGSYGLIIIHVLLHIMTLKHLRPKHISPARENTSTLCYSIIFLPQLVQEQAIHSNDIPSAISQGHSCRAGCSLMDRKPLINVAYQAAEAIISLYLPHTKQHMNRHFRLPVASTGYGQDAWDGLGIYCSRTAGGQ